MEHENLRKVIYNPKNEQYYSLRQRSSHKGRKGTIMGVWTPEHIVVLGRAVQRTRFLMQLLTMLSAAIILTVAVVPLMAGSLWFPQNVLSLLTGFGSGMIVVIIPLVISEIRKAPHE